MKVWKLCLLFAFPLLSSTLAEDTVAEDLGVHQLQRLVALLTSKECKDLLVALSHPEENIFQHLDRLSPEKNPLDLPPRAKRDTSSSSPPSSSSSSSPPSSPSSSSSSSSSAEISEAQCRDALTEWLLTYGERIYYDRLSRGLQHIGRSDIAIEMGTNVNEDKIHNLKRYVDDYHKYVRSLNISAIRPDAGTKEGDRRILKRDIKDLTWQDLDLVVEQAPVPRYQRGVWDVALPFVCGLLLGFGGAAFTLLIVLYASKRLLVDSSRYKTLKYC